MRSFLRVFATAFVLLVIVMASVLDMARPVGADDEGKGRKCESLSEHYRGVCFKNNCAYVCQSEGFTDGHCRGLRRECYCTKDCE